MHVKSLKNDGKALAINYVSSEIDLIEIIKTLRKKSITLKSIF